jgi:macrolide-specific efflux system membrane fusion protein
MATLRRNQAAFARQQQMLAAEATSQAEFELAQAELIASQEQIKVLDAQIIQSQTALSTAQANLGYTRIVAPMDGTVVALVVEEGQTVNANQSTPTIVKLAKLDTVTISAEISEADVIRVKPGQPVYFTILGNPRKRYHATLRTVEPAPASIATEGSNAASGGTASAAIYYNGLFDVDNPDGELRISMTAMVYIVQAQAQQVLTIPASALGQRSRDGGYSVRVVNAKGETETRSVSIGINNNVVAEVLDGLVDGETVVVGEASATRAPVDAEQQRRSMRRMM